MTTDRFKILLDEEMLIKPQWDHPTEIRKKEIRDKLKEIEGSEKELLAKKAELETELKNL